MAYIEIPDGLLSDSEMSTLQEGIRDAVGEKQRTGRMTLSRFIDIIKSVCSYIWDKIKNIISGIWDSIKDFFS